MHLPLARLVSIPVLFCLLPTSTIVILVFYLFSTGISEHHVWELWVWIQSTGLTLRLRVTLMNNPITLITSIYAVAGLHFCCADSYMRSSANFRIVFTAQCTLVHLRGLGIACHPSVRLSVCLSVCNVRDLWSHRLEILETNCIDN